MKRFFVLFAIGLVFSQFSNAQVSTNKNEELGIILQVSKPEAIRFKNVLYSKATLSNDGVLIVQKLDGEIEHTTIQNTVLEQFKLEAAQLWIARLVKYNQLVVCAMVESNARTYLSVGNNLKLVYATRSCVYSNHTYPEDPAMLKTAENILRKIDRLINHE